MVSPLYNISAFRVSAKKDFSNEEKRIEFVLDRLNATLKNVSIIFSCQKKSFYSVVFSVKKLISITYYCYHSNAAFYLLHALHSCILFSVLIKPSVNRKRLVLSLYSVLYTCKFLTELCKILFC